MGLLCQKKRAVFVVWMLLFSFLFALPAVLSAEICAPMPIDTISDLIAAEKIRLGLRMEGVSQPPIIRSGDAADQKKMYAVLNSFFAEPEKAVPVNRHKQRVAAKLEDALLEPSLDSLVEKEIAILADEHGEDKTLLSLMDLFYLDKETKARNYFFGQSQTGGGNAACSAGRKTKNCAGNEPAWRGNKKDAFVFSLPTYPVI